MRLGNINNKLVATASRWAQSTLQLTPREKLACSLVAKHFDAGNVDRVLNRI